MYIEGDDTRIDAVKYGFAVAVHPLRLPNTRALFSTASSVSAINFSFVRIAGLLGDMVPLRPGIDNVRIDGASRVFGYVDVLFDTWGFEFRQRCWVINIGSSQFVDMILGFDWAEHYNPRIDWREDMKIEDARAKKVRQVQDVYVTR